MAGDIGWQVEVFFDSECPLCSKEIALLRRLDKEDRVRFTDIAQPSFSPPEGLEMEALMDRIHGRLPGGEIIEGVEVFRRLYAAVGFEWAVKPTRLPGISGALDLAYRVFAKNRLKWTGRCDAEVCTVHGADISRAEDGGQ